MLAGHGSTIDVDKQIERYSSRFPRPSQIRTSFGLTVCGPDRIPALPSQANLGAEMQLALNRFQAANLEKAQLEAVERAFQQKQAMTKAAIIKGAEYAEKRILQTVQEVLQRLEANNLDLESANPRTRRAVVANLDDLKQMLEMPLLPAGLSDLVGDLATVAKGAQDKADLQAKIDAIVEAMATRHEFSYQPAANSHRGGAILGRKSQPPAYLADDPSFD